MQLLNEVHYRTFYPVDYNSNFGSKVRLITYLRLPALYRHSCLFFYMSLSALIHSEAILALKFWFQKFGPLVTLIFPFFSSLHDLSRSNIEYSSYLNTNVSKWVTNYIFYAISWNYLSNSKRFLPETIFLRWLSCYVSPITLKCA